MKKAKSRIKVEGKKPWKALIGVSLVTSMLWGGVFNVLSNIETGSQDVIVIEKIVTKEVEKAEDYIPSPNTLRLIEANPGVYGAIYRRFGDEARMYAELIAREASLDPSIINAGSGACGLAQALPCSKMECSLDMDGVDCQLDWIAEYVEDRYGTIQHTLVFHDIMNYY